MKNSRVKFWAIGCLTMCWCFLGHWLLPVGGQTIALKIPGEFETFMSTPFNRLPGIPCTDQLKQQVNRQPPGNFDCQVGTTVSPDKLLLTGNFNSLGLHRTSMEAIAKMNGIDLNQVDAGKLQKFYALITPAKLLGNRFNGFYQNQSLGSMPLVQEALVQYLAQQSQVVNSSQMQSLNTLIRNAGGIGNFANGSLNTEQFRQQIAQLPLSRVVAAIPGFGNYSVGNVPPQTLKSFTVGNAIPGIIRQPLTIIPGSELLKLDDLAAIGLPGLSIKKFPNPLNLLPGAKAGRFDLPLGADENPRSYQGRQVSGGYPGKDFRKQDCSNTCKFVEISAPGTSYHGAIWIDGENWVPDGYSYACLPWGCKGPAGSHPFGADMRFLLTNINASKGTAVVSVSFRACDYFQTTCTPAVFPIPSGLPYATLKEGSTLRFILPINYGT
jgi:hypothetical protein